jgi:hypothetical protein
LRGLATVRGAQGIDWVEGRAEWLATTAWGRGRDSVGLDGWIAFWAAVQRLGEAVLRASELDVLRLEPRDDPEGRDALHRAAAEWLGLELRPPAMKAAQLDALAGRWAWRDGHELELLRDGDALIARHLPFLWPDNRLIPTAPDRLTAESWPIEFEVTSDSELTIHAADRRDLGSLTKSG